MPYRVVISSVLLLLSGAVTAQGPTPAVSYARDIQPIFTEKCVACHACNDAACQLNLGSGEGAARGASKIPVYDGERRRASAPTRLFYDAFGEQGLTPSAKEALQIAQWENLLNAPGSRESLVGRWLFEHWFLAHIYFKDGEPGHFFQWVRSRTPPGQRSS